MDKIVAPKQSCPRDLGFWYCQNCINRQAESQSEVDFVVPMTFCDTKYGDKVCGETHQGYELCKDCIVAGREEYAHIGEYEIVKTIGETPIMQLYDLQEPAFKFDEFGTLLKERIKVIFIDQDGWEHAVDLPVIPRPGDQIAFHLDEDTIVTGVAINVHWTIRPDRFYVTVQIRAVMFDNYEKATN